MEPLWVPFRIVVGATHLAVVVTTLFHIVTRCIARRRAAEGKARAVQRGVKGSAMLGARRSTHPPVRGLSGAGSAASEVHHSQSLLAHDSLGERARSTRPRPIPAGKGRGSSSEASTSASPQMALSIESAASASPFSGRADRSVSRSGRTRRAPTPVTPTESQYDGDASDAETASIQGTPAIAGSRARKRPMAFSDIVSVFCCAGSCLRLVWLVDPFGTLGIFGQTLVDVFLLRTPQVCFLLALLVVIGMWYRVLNAVAPNPKELRRVNTLLWCTAAVMVCLAVVPSSLAAFGIGLPLTLALTNVSLALFVVIMTLYGAMHALRLSGELSAAARRTNAMLEQQSTGAGSLAATDATAKLLQQQVRFNEARLSIVVTMRIFVFLGATMCAFGKCAASPMARNRIVLTLPRALCSHRGENHGMEPTPSVRRLFRLRVDNAHLRVPARSVSHARDIPRELAALSQLPQARPRGEVFVVDVAGQRKRGRPQRSRAWRRCWCGGCARFWQVRHPRDHAKYVCPHREPGGEPIPTHSRDAGALGSFAAGCR